MAQLGIIVAALIQVNEHLTMEEFAEEAKVQAAAPAVMKKKNQEGTKLNVKLSIKGKVKRENSHLLKDR